RAGESGYARRGDESGDPTGLPAQRQRPGAGHPGQRYHRRSGDGRLRCLLRRAGESSGYRCSAASEICADRQQLSRGGKRASRHRGADPSALLGADRPFESAER
ncbi:hypothetical protein COLO4_01301, partial [Corchorus olitorius]